MAQTYADKLRDPRWQKKRLQVFERDNFTCTLCGDDKSTLHVHHLKYANDPIETDIQFLKTLCEQCHVLVEYLKKQASYKIDYPIAVYKRYSKGETPLRLMVAKFSDGNVVLVLYQDGVMCEFIGIHTMVIDEIQNFLSK